MDADTKNTLAALSAFTALAFFCLMCHGCSGAEVVYDGRDPEQSLQIATEAAKVKKLPCYVLVGADWCAACKTVDRTLTPTIKERGIYLHLNYDQHKGPLRRLAALIGRPVTTLPTLVILQDQKAPLVAVGPYQIRQLVH